jgi:hypothetical protein
MPSHSAGGWRKIAVVLEPGRSGVTALDRAVALAREHEAKLIVLALAPHAESPRCGGSSRGYNDAVCDTVAGELEAAACHVGPSTPPASFVLLVEGRDNPPHRWIRERRVDLVLLPARRLRLLRPRHPAARRLRRRSGAEIRVVSR